MIFCYSLQPCLQYARFHILDTESFGSTFGKKATRKRPSLKYADLDSFHTEVGSAIATVDFYRFVLLFRGHADEECNSERKAFA